MNQTLIWKRDLRRILVARYPDFAELYLRVVPQRHRVKFLLTVYRKDLELGRLEIITPSFGREACTGANLYKWSKDFLDKLFRAKEES